MRKVSIQLILLAVGLFQLTASATLSDAQRFYEQGRNAEALAEVESLLAANPEDAELRFLRGIIFAETGRADRAVEVFAKLTQDYPELPEPWNNLAVLFAEQGEFDKSREALLAAIQTHPSYSTAHENLGDLYARMAGMAYDQALEQDRANESARLKLSAVNGLFAAPRSNTDPIVVAAVDPKPATRPNPVEPKPVEPKPVEPKPVEPKPVEPKPVEPKPVEPKPVEPKPVEPKPVEQAVIDNSAVIESVVRRWASAWSNKDVPGYLASYSRSFRPSNGASFRAWSRYREERLTKPKVIEVDLSNIQVSQTDGNNAIVTFRQKYRSDNYRDEVTKDLTFRKTDGAWLIVAEESR